MKNLSNELTEAEKALIPSEEEVENALGFCRQVLDDKIPSKDDPESWRNLNGYYSLKHS